MLKTLSVERFEVLERSSFDEAPQLFEDVASINYGLNVADSHPWLEWACDFGFAVVQDCIY